MQPSETQLERLEQLERFVRNAKILLLISVVAVVAVIVFGKHALASPSEKRILHVGGIVIEDRACNDRVHLGITDSTAPKLEVRDRHEKLTFDALAAPHK